MTARKKIEETKAFVEFKGTITAAAKGIARYSAKNKKNIMRKLIATVALLFVTALSVSAQNVKKVAVWETESKSKGISSLKMELVRSGLEEAIDNTPGYIKFDRAKFEDVLKEHKFQRSGAVKDNDVKRMGQYAGVQYVIVPQVELDGTDFLIVARVIDVETGESQTRKELCNSSSSEIDNACSRLAAKLFNSTNCGTGTAQRSSGNSGTKQSQKSVAQGYTDLGLPSGTIWKNFNATGFYTYDEAVSQFGNRLPTKEQWEELKAECQWSWTGSGYKVTGPNGNSISLPAAGYRSCNGGVGYVGSRGDYWSSAPYGSERAWSLYFSSGSVRVYNGNGRRCGGQSVRLVQD